MRVRLTVTGCAKVASAVFRVGGQGKPVRIRRGPATVTGDAARTGASAPEPLDRRRRAGKARDGRPGSQETSPDRKAHIALVERGGFMLHRLAGLALAVLALLVPASVAAAAPAAVTVRVEGSAQTLLPRTAITTTTTPVVKDGDPTHSCTGTSVAGALEIATRGSWTATWDPGLKYFVNSILGEAPSGSAFFTLWVNSRS